MDYLVTGTRAYGPAREDSDLDIVMYVEDAMNLHKFLISHHISPYRKENMQEGYDGYYFELLNIKVNIIIAMDDAMFRGWKVKTETMKRLPGIEDRQKRIHLFNLFGEIFI